MKLQRLATIAVGAHVGIVSQTDRTRRMFTVRFGDELCLLSGTNLEVVHRWRVPTEHPDPYPRPEGSHALWPEGRLALLSGAKAVRLLEPDGAERWSTAHTPWSGSRDSGCAWFDEQGRAFAVIPDPESSMCLVVHLDLETGQVLAQAPVAGEPAGISLVPQKGWMGLSEGEGQDATRAWWIRLDDGARIEVKDPKWDDLILADADPRGERILTTPHGEDNVLTVRTFPGLEVMRTITAPDADSYWLETACFAGEHLIAQLGREGERTVAIAPDGTINRLAVGEGWIVGAEHGSWLIAGRSQIARWAFVES